VMKKLRRFKCGSCQRKYESLVEDDVKSIKCECGKDAVRVIAVPRCFSNTVGRSPSAK
jgi:transposase-like protein